MRGRDHGQCLTEETLTEYLEGGLDPAIKAASEVHLVACDDCRERLGFFMRILKPEVGAEEVKVLETITNEWDKRKRGEKKTEAAGGLRRFLPALVALAAILILGMMSARFLMKRSAEPRSGGEVVQLLLAQNRPFESRMASEPYRPIVRTRGTDDPGVSYSLLAGEMTRLSATSHEMGRFYLLQKDFNRAIPYLEIAEREVGASAAVHNDLGVAYLESDNAQRASRSGQEFQHALSSDGSFAPAAFNLAVFYERTNARAEAAAQWKRYLELDSNSDWAKEAQGRLQGLSR